MQSRASQDYFILTALWVVVHALLWIHFGHRSLFDAAGYVQGADHLIQHGRLEDFHHAFYVVPITILAFFRLIFSESVFPFLLFQSVLSLGAVFLLAKGTRNVTGERTAGVVAGIVFLLWWDNIQWNTVVMTESLFCSLTCFTLWWVTRFTGTWLDYAGLLVACMLLCLTRPAGVVVTAGAVAFLLGFHRTFLSQNLWRAIVVVTLITLLAIAGATQMLSHWDFTDQYRRGNIVTYIDTVKGSPLYSSSLQLDTHSLEFPDEDLHPIKKIVLFAWNNPVHFLKAAFLKVVFLLTGVRPYYSTIHNIVLISWIAAVYSFAYSGMKIIAATPVGLFIAGVILANIGLVATSTVDWDNRFYIPMEPGIVMLAGAGVVRSFRRREKAPGKSAGPEPHLFP